jgi:Protein of unknown function (DUF2971)
VCHTQSLGRFSQATSSILRREFSDLIMTSAQSRAAARIGDNMDNPQLIIVPPKTVFKYEGFNVNSLMNLKKQSIYFGSPTRFNDPFDCTITASIAEPTESELEKMRECYLDRDDIGADARAQLESMPPGNLKVLLVKTFTETCQEQQKRFLENNGVSCFSEVNDNLLMWAHYGESYRGFCLEFRTNYYPLEKLRPVRYVDIIPEISLVPIACEQDATQQFEIVYCTKSKAWSYEQEWRAFHKNVGTLYCYPPHVLKAVYFGPRIDKQAVDLVCQILAAQNSQVELWLGKTIEKGFKIVFDKQTGYTPLTLAKSLGWL